MDFACGASMVDSARARQIEARAQICDPVAGTSPHRYHIVWMIDYTKRLLRLVRALSPVDRQNRLMATPDRELALAMMYMDAVDRSELLSVVSVAKRRRIDDELRLESHLSIRYEHFRTAIETVIQRLDREANADGAPAESDGWNGRPVPLRSYLRPRRAPHRGRDR